MAAGAIYFNKDALDIALDYYLKAYDYYEDKPPSERFKLENNLAIVYARTEREDEALPFFKKVLAFQKREKDTVKLAQIHNNIGNPYMKNEVDSSLVYFKESLQLAKGIREFT